MFARKWNKKKTLVVSIVQTIYVIRMVFFLFYDKISSEFSILRLEYEWEIMSDIKVNWIQLDVCLYAFSLCFIVICEEMQEPEFELEINKTLLI